MAANKAPSDPDDEYIRITRQPRRRSGVCVAIPRALVGGTLADLAALQSRACGSSYTTIGTVAYGRPAVQLCQQQASTLLVGSLSLAGAQALGSPAASVDAGYIEVLCLPRAGGGPGVWATVVHTSTAAPFASFELYLLDWREADMALQALVALHSDPPSLTIRYPSGWQNWGWPP